LNPRPVNRKSNALPQRHHATVVGEWDDVCCRLDADVTQPSCSVLSAAGFTDANCRPSTQSSSGHVTRTTSPTHTCDRSLMDAWQARTSTAVGVGGTVLHGVDLALAAVVLGSSGSAASTPASPSRANTAQRRPEMRIHVTTDSPERASSSHGQTGARPASAVGRRSAGVPHGSLRAFQQQQQQQERRHNTLLVVPSSRSASSSPSMVVSARGGSVSTSPSSASPSPSPEPISRHPSSPGRGGSATSRSLSTHRPLGVARPPVATDDHSKPSRTCVQRHCDQTSRADEQETFVWRRRLNNISPPAAYCPPTAL